MYVRSVAYVMSLGVFVAIDDLVGCVISETRKAKPSFFIAMSSVKQCLLCFPIASSSGRSSPNPSSSDEAMMNREQIIRYLKRNPDFLDEFVANHINAERIEKWLSRHGSSKRVNGAVNKAKPILKRNLQDLKRVCEETALISKQESDNRSIDRRTVLLNLTKAISRTFSPISEARLYLADETENYIEDAENRDRRQEIKGGKTTATFCARERSSVRGNTTGNNKRYPEGMKGGERGRHYEVMNVPLIDYRRNSLIAVMEFYRALGNPFSATDEGEAALWSSWAKLAFSKRMTEKQIGKQHELGDFLMNVVKSVFMEMISMDTLIVKIMSFAQKLVDADRASLFLVDTKTNQLYARIFDVNGDSANDDDRGEEEVNQDSSQVQREIRFPVGIGIAGVVADTGQTLNVSDAYNDPRFNKAIDEQTGYVTKNILCMPISIRGQVIGIVQMVNKAEGSFTQEDEEAFAVFSVYCGLALHHAKLYDKIRRSEQKYRVALEVLSYHNSSSIGEVEQILEEPVGKEDPEITE